MKRLLILLFFLPVLFACSKEELFEEGQEVVLNFSVDMGEMQSATRAFADDANRSSDLWLVVFDSEGYLVEYTKATITGTTNSITSFKATLHATLEGRIMHLLLNYDDDNDAETDLEFSYGHENNIIGGLTVERNRGDVYWQRVELPEGIVGKETVEKYLTKVPLVRNFSKITVTVAENSNTEGFVLNGFYVLNVPNSGTVAPFVNGEFVKYYNENAQFNGASFTSKNYTTLTAGGYHGSMPDNDVRIQTATEASKLTSLSDKSPYYLYESTYVNGNKDKTVSVLLYGTYNNANYWYRVDLVKPNSTTGVIEYFDVLRNFAYNINITAVTAGKTSAQDAITQPAGNNILSSLEIAHLTNVSDGTASLEVNYTDTVLITNDNVTIRYKFTDKGRFTDELKQTHGITVDHYTNGDIKSKTNDKCGYYVTYEGNIDPDNSPISVAIAEGGANEDWRDVTIEVIGEIKARKEVSVTFFALSTTGTVLSRTVHYTLMPRQTMLVECPAQVDAEVGKAVGIDILIPDGLPEAMFPLDFAIEAQAHGNKSYLAQYITPSNDATVSVKTGNSIVPGFTTKKSFQYVVSLTYAQYSQLDKDKRTVNGYDMDMRILSTAFKTNTAQSASTVYAYNRYFTQASDYFLNDYFMATFSNDETENYGVGRSVTLNITAGQAGNYTISSSNADEVTTSNIATRAISNSSYTLAAGEIKSVNLTASTFAEQVSATVTCSINGESVSKTVTAKVRNKLNPKVSSAKYNNTDVSDTQELGIYTTQTDAQNRVNAIGITTISDLNAGNQSYTIAELSESTTIYFSYKTDNYIYTASATANALSAGTAALSFTRTEIKANITNVTLSGDKYYGEGNQLTLTFTTDQPGDYKITLTEGNESIEKTYNIGTAGTKTLNEDWLKTQTWSDQVQVTIFGVGATATKNGTTRNTIKLGKFTMGSNSPNANNTTITVTYTSSSGSTKTETLTRKNLTDGGKDLVMLGITDEGSFVFSYTTGTGNNKKTYKSQALTVAEVMANTKLDFTEQK